MALPLSYNVRNVAARWQSTLLAVGGIAVVIAVLVALHAMAAGFRRTLRATGRPDNAIVVQRGAQSEPASFFARSHAETISADARIARGADGQPLVSPEVVVVATLPSRATGEPVNVTLRGVTERALHVRGGIRLLEGRMARAGLPEIMVGSRVQPRVAGLDLGANLRLQGRDWSVVGVFAADGGAFESEMWAPVDLVSTAFHREGGQSSLVVRLADAASVPSFASDVRAFRHMQVEAHAEDAFYEQQSAAVTKPLLALMGLVVVIMGIGAVFAAMNTMNAIVAARTKEIATLRVLGFSARAVLLAFVLESALLALAGGVLGCVLALPVHAMRGGTGNTAGFAEIAWGFQVTPAALALALATATAIGVGGGLVPAIRAARTPLTTALRAS